MNPMKELFTALLEGLADHLPNAILVGGWAVNFHGHVRYTDDIDFWTDRAHAGQARRVLEAMGLTITRFDDHAIAAHRPYRIEFHLREALDPTSSITLPLFGRPITILTAPALIQYKLERGWFQDQTDATCLIALQEKLKRGLGLSLEDLRDLGPR